MPDQDWLEVKMKDRWGAFLTERLRKRYYLVKTGSLARSVALAASFREKSPNFISLLHETHIIWGVYTGQGITDWGDGQTTGFPVGDVRILVIAPDIEIVPEGTIIPIVEIPDAED